MKYSQMQAKNRKEVERIVDGKKETVIRFKGVLRFAEDNESYLPKPKEGADTRTASQKRKSVWREISRMLEAPKGRSNKQTEVNITNALQAYRDEMEAEAQKPEAAGMSVYEIVSDYVSRREANSAGVGWNTSMTLANGEKVIQPSTVRDYRHTLKVIEPKFSKLSVSDLNTREMIDWENKMLADGNGISRVRKAHVLIKAALDEAAVRMLIEANPIASMKAPTIRDNGTDKGLTQADMKRATKSLSETAEAAAHVVGAMIGLHCGLRVGEVAGLTWDDIDLEYRIISVRRAIGIGDGGCFVKLPKSKAGERQVFIDDRVKDMLTKRRAMMLEARDNNAEGFGSLYVCGSLDGESYLSPTTLSKRWSTLASTWGLKDQRDNKTCTFHGLRHSFVSAMRATRASDIDEEKIMSKIAGHSSTRMTERYGSRDWKHVFPEMMAASAYMEPDEVTE